MSTVLKLRLSFIACLAVAGLAFPAGSLAASCAPPGNAGVDQYLETVPGANCNHSSGGGGGHHGGGSLPPGTSAQLSKQGAVGSAVKRLVASSGVSSNSGGSGAAAGQSGNGTGHSKSIGKSVSVPTANLSGSGRNPLSGLLHPVLTGDSSGGIGVLLPVVLGSALGVALLMTVLRRRFRSTGPQT
jgi:hypothetical protein